MQKYVIKYILRRKHDPIKEQENKRVRVIYYLKDMAVNNFGKCIKITVKMNVYYFHLYNFIFSSNETFYLISEIKKIYAICFFPHKKVH